MQAFAVIVSPDVSRRAWAIAHDRDGQRIGVAAAGDDLICVDDGTSCCIALFRTRDEAHACARACHWPGQTFDILDLSTIAVTFRHAVLAASAGWTSCRADATSSPLSDDAASPWTPVEVSPSSAPVARPKRPRPPERTDLTPPAGLRLREQGPRT
jgi:hypothetical protein